jgi:DNA modification methylase
MYELNNIYCEDFFKAAESITKDSINLVVTSPPYFDARTYKNKAKYEDGAEEWFAFCYEMLSALNYVLKYDGVIWWNTGSGYRNHKKMTTIYKLIIELEKDNLFLIEDIPWCKTSFLPKTYQNRPYAAYEHNLVFARNPELVNYYVDQVREPYAESTLARLKYPVGNLQADKSGEFTKRKMVTPNPLGKAPPNYLLLKVDTSKRKHPAPMAKELASWAIRAYSKPGDLVLDPMAGCGTTLTEAKKHGRMYLGFDIVPEYVELAKEALNDREVE